MSELPWSEEDPQVAVVFPWRDRGDKDRAASKAWLTEWYREMHPEWDLIHTDGGGGEWNKPTAINYGVGIAKAMGAEVVIVSDTDVFPLTDRLKTAARHAMLAPWIVPHGRVLRLRPEPTAELLKRRPGPRLKVPTSPLVRGSYRGMAGGGLFVIRADSFMAAGGFDPRFQQWGAEDSAFGVAADTILGPNLRYEHIPLVHLYHDPGLRESNPHYGPNVELKREYDRASLEREAMIRMRGVRPVPQPQADFPRPAREASFEDWLLYCYSLGLREQIRSVRDKLGLVALAIQEEHRRRQA
jgi:hypothetical protein